MFSIGLNEKLSWLYNGLNGNNGYWLANSVLGDVEMAWTIQNGNIKPNIISNSSSIGVRPVIVISKDKINLGD